MNKEPNPKRDFPDTRWSIIVDAADLKSPSRDNALKSLVESYLPALKAHLILRRRLKPDAVDDFLQDFVLKKILEQNVVAKADSNRGRFRSFILKSLDNFVRDYFRSNKMHDRLVEFDEDLDQGDQSGVPSVSEVAWARQVFCNAVHRFKNDCERSKSQSRWKLFQERLLIPVVSPNETTNYDQLAKICKLESPKHARNAMVGAKRAFDKALRSVIKEYVLDESLVDSELEDLLRVLKGSDVLDEAVSEFVQPQDLKLNEASFHSIRFTGFFEMSNDAKVMTDPELSRSWLEILNMTFEQLGLSDAYRGIDPEQDPAARSVADVLFEPSPSLKMLDLLREYAKGKYSGDAGIEDAPCYFVLYMTSIAAAVYKHQKTLTRLPVDQLQKNFEWVLEYCWLDPKSHEYLQIARRVARRVA